MFSTISVSAPGSQPEGKRPRNKYSRLICLGCRERRIRCELPKDVDIPRYGELREVQTPCYRCRRLGIHCVIRQTILGRPSTKRSAISNTHLQPITPNDMKLHIWIDTSLPNESTTAQRDTAVVHEPINPHMRPGNGGARCWNKGTLVLHKPQSSETIVIIHAIDTLRREKVEQEWFRHLPAYYGQTPALDLAIKAIVQASAYARGVAHLTTRACFQALSPVLDALKANITQSPGQLGDDILAAIALLAPFEGTIKRDGIPSRLHINGLAAIMTATPRVHSASQLARDILDWYAAESSIMACILGVPSPFEKIPRAYFASDGLGCGASDRERLKALSNELSIRIPRLVMLAGMLRLQQPPQHALLLDAYTLLQSLLKLQDPRAERRFLQNVTVQPPPPHGQSLHFASVKDYETLTYYWQSRLSLLRLDWYLHRLIAFHPIRVQSTDAQTLSLSPRVGPQTNEMRQVVQCLIMSAENVPPLPLFKQQHVLAHAMIMVWGATMDGIQQCAERSGSLSELLLRRVNRALNAKPAFLAHDMDEAADIFVGGERKSRFARIYGL